MAWFEAGAGQRFFWQDYEVIQGATEHYQRLTGVPRVILKGSTEFISSGDPERVRLLKEFAERRESEQTPGHDDMGEERKADEPAPMSSRRPTLRHQPTATELKRRETLELEELQKVNDHQEKAKKLKLLKRKYLR